MQAVRTGVEWINTFSGPCSQANLTARAACAEGFQNAMAAQGHTSVFDWGDLNAWETDFRSPSNGGDSFNWSDNVHFCYFSDHGGNDGSTFSIAFTAEHDNCLAFSDTWQLGGNMLKWIVFDTCDLVLQADAANVSQWFGPLQGVHMVFGFVGLTYDEGGRGEYFGRDASDGQVLSNSWLVDAGGFGTGQTAIAIAAGASQSEAISRRDYETLYQRDSDVTATNWLAWKWYG
jgi:hypothetical protein